MYGVKESDLSSGDTSFDEIFEERDTRVAEVDIGGRKTVNLTFEPTEEDSYLGFLAGYPWDFAGTSDEFLTFGDVEEAIAGFLKKYGYNTEEVKKKCGEISTYNCC